ncbi:predicted protein [Botrytis cinerea T4]|uniref:Uncharacterized protein n=1 Tax=Botryotinia fuckeliana (strain T4) TaxID=999810 RepID=G2YX87_BOTF4|nr:predicted protein [Botrytis cinerea T4]
MYFVPLPNPKAVNMIPTTYLKAYTESNVITQNIASEAEKVGFHRWKSVTAYPGPYTLHRSSSPNYISLPDDPSQFINAKGIAFLQKHNIRHVVCLNNDEPSSFVQMDNVLALRK